MTWAGVWRLKYGLVFGVGSGRLAVAAVSFFSFAFGVGSCDRGCLAFVFCCSIASYSDHSSKLTTF